MGASQEDRVEAIVAEVREAARRRRGAAEQPEPASLALEAEAAQDLTRLFAHQEIGAVELGSHRRFAGGLVGLAKRLLRRLLTPILEGQAAYNRSNTRLTEHLVEELREARRRQAALEERLQALERSLEGSTDAEKDASAGPPGQRTPAPGLARDRRRVP
jgi:hypothetical protein